MQVLISDLMVKQPPVWLLGLPPPVVEAEHDGEGAGGPQLPSVLVLLVLVIQAVSRGQCKSVSNLGKKQNWKKKNTENHHTIDALA